MDEKMNFNEDHADFVNNELKKRQTERIPHELQWRLNTEFIKGNQFLNINTQLRKIDEVPKMYWWQEREVFNQIATIVDTRISRLTRQKPMLKTRPAGSEENDYQTSKISSMILNMKWEDENMDDKYLDLVTWIEHTGNAFIKNTWDSGKGRLMGTTVQMEEEEVEEGFKIPREVETEVFEGDVDTTIVSPYEFYPDSCSRNSLSECKSLIHAKAFHVKDIEDMYGVDVESEDIDSFGLQSGSGLSGVTYNTGSYKTTNEKLKDHAIVKEYYERPSKQHPQGRLIIVAGDKTLYNGELPYVLGEDGKRDFPFTQVKCIAIPNMFFGQSIAERCIPIQRRYNALRNRKAEYLNLVAIGQWYEPMGSLDDDSELNNAPGSVIRYQPGAGKPDPVSFPSLPNSFEQEQQALLSEFTAVSGVSELSRFSEAPSGVKSGVALSIANEQDDTRIAMTASRIAEGVKNTGKHWLRLYKQFVQEERVVRSVGMNVDVFSWSASDLTSEDVIIENSSALSETPAQRRQMVFDLVGTGIFNRPDNNPFTREGAKKLLELIEIGHWETGVDETYELHENKAKRENRSFMQGQPVQPADFDDHAIHVQEHNKFRLSTEYEELIATPEGQMIAQMIAEHIAMHQQIIAQQEMMQMQQQMAMQMQGQPPQ